jgi:hypothetical protein
MPLDTSIPLQVKPVQFDSPFEAQAKALQMKDMMGRSQLAEMQLGQQRDAMTRQQTLRDLYKGMPADLPETGRIAALRNSGFQDEAEKWEGAALKRDETRSKISKEDFELAKGRVSLIGKTLAGLRRPNVTTEEVVQNIALLAQMKALPDEQAAMIARSVPPTGPALQDFLLSENQKNADADKLLESLRPKIVYKDTGKMLVPVDENANTNPNPQPLKLTTTPGQDQQASVTMRGQNMVDARTREATEQGKWQYDADRGGVVNVKTGEFKPATQGGAPIGAKDKPMTDAQAKAALFGSRMEAADKIINDLAAQGVNKSIPGSRAPFGVGAAINVVAPEKRQMLDQAKRDFINATLRRESGAVISPEEFDNAEKQYFPQPGDSDAVMQQKARNRAIATRGIQAEVPNARKTVEGIIGGAPAKPAGVKDLGGGFTLKN